MRNFFVIDVESLGLFGRAFWVAYTVIDEQGRELAFGSYHMATIPVHDSEKFDYAWVESNVPRPPSDSIACLSRSEMQERFWKDWMDWHAKGAYMAAECAWPVETNFLLNCLQDRKSWQNQSPYPLIDIATWRMAKGKDPLATEFRLARELPKHNPLADARQSARLLLEVL